MIHCSAPVLIVFLSWLLLGEPIRPAAGLCMAVCALGLFLDIAPWQHREKSAGGGSFIGYLLAFGSTIGSAFTYTSLRALKGVRPTTSLTALYTCLLIIGFLLALNNGYALATQGAGSVAVYKFLTPIFEIGWNAAFF